MRSERLLVAGCFALIFGLTGCTSTSPAPEPSSAPITVKGSTVVKSPKWAKSAKIQVTCEGTSVVLTVDNEAAMRTIDCVSVRTFVAPVSSQLDLKFEPASDTTLTATVTFSRAAFKRDEVLVRQCAAATTALSDILSADNGVASGAIDQIQAQALMAQALTTLAAAPSSGTAAKDLEPLHAWLTANPTGDPRRAPMPRQVIELCADNESPVYLSSSYGG